MEKRLGSKTRLEEKFLEKLLVGDEGRARLVARLGREAEAIPLLQQALELVQQELNKVSQKQMLQKETM